MTLGPDRTICLAELKAALQPLVGDGVDTPPADACLAALAQAIYAILVNDAIVVVSQAEHKDLWEWLDAVGTKTGVGPPPAITPLTGELT